MKCKPCNAAAAELKVQHRGLRVNERICWHKQIAAASLEPESYTVLQTLTCSTFPLISSKTKYVQVLTEYSKAAHEPIQKSVLAVLASAIILLERFWK